MRYVCRIVVMALVLVMAPLSGVAPAQGEDRPRDLLQKADAITAKVATLRGLKPKHAIRRGVMNKDQIRERLLKRMADEYSPAEIAAEELAMKRLGLLPRDADYKKLVIDLLTDQIAGFYDPVEKHLYLAGWQPSGMEMFEDILMAHEIDHALQDQHFDLRAFMKIDKQNSDATIARQAVVEGDGTALMFEFLLNKMGAEMPWSQPATINALSNQISTSMAGSGLENIPLVLRDGLLFPYVGGLGFVAHFRRHAPWTRIDAVYKKPPLSTEHILHPERYQAYERPDEIRAGAVAALAGYETVYNNINGELGLSVFLRSHLASAAKKPGGPQDKAERAAAGWGGDRLVIYTPPGHQGGPAGAVAVSYTVWDETADAIEFFEILSDVMPSLSGGKPVKETDDHIEYRDTSGQVFAAQRKGDAVVLVIGAPAEHGATILAQVWKTWRVKRR